MRVRSKAFDRFGRRPRQRAAAAAVWPRKRPPPPTHEEPSDQLNNEFPMNCV